MRKKRFAVTPEVNGTYTVHEVYLTGGVLETWQELETFNKKENAIAYAEAKKDAYIKELDETDGLAQFRKDNPAVFV